MTRYRLRGVLTLATLVTLLTACAVGPEYQRPQPPSPAQWHASLPHGGDPTRLATWWSQFDDPLLAELIAAAEHDNPGLDQALARIAQSRAGVAAARSALFPALAANAIGQASGGELGPLTPNQTLGKAALDAAWEIDLFGANQRRREAAQARYEGAQAMWHDARVSLAAEVAQTYVGLRACEWLAKSGEEDLASRRESERLTQLRVGAGFDAPTDGALSMASAAEAEARLNAQQAECDISVKALVELSQLDEAELRRRLAGRSGILPTPSMFSVQQIPAQVLAQRPDIAAVERQLAAASAEIGVAEAARYPSLSLLGSVGLQSLSSGGVTLDGSLWSFGPSLNLPIFNAGRLAADADAAQARYDEARASYSGRVRQAVREVEQALVRLNSASTREDTARRAAEGYHTVFLAAGQRLRVGAGSLLELEEARRIAVAARTSLLAVQRERVSAWISLYRAAGGGWSPTAEQRPEPSPTILPENPQ